MPGSTGIGRFVWYDLMSPDTESSRQFYMNVLGWGTRADRPLMGVEGQPPYVMWTAGDVPIAGLVPFNEGYWLGYVAVADVGRSATQANDLGGEVLFGPADIPMVGRFAVISDPQGAVIALFQRVERGSSPPSFAPKPLEFSRHELATSDCRVALDFYTAMFGWELISENDAGPLGVSIVFGQKGVPYGGMFDKPPAMQGAAWCYSVRVDDVREAAKRVVQNGGRVIREPSQIAGGDWIAQCHDPSGSLFALHQMRP